MEHQIRAYGDRPARTEHRVRYQLTVNRDEEALAAAEFRTGWRIYATNAPGERLTLTEAVLAYQYIEENIFRRLQGKFLSITSVRAARRSCARLVPATDLGGVRVGGEQLHGQTGFSDRRGRIGGHLSRQSQAQYGYAHD